MKKINLILVFAVLFSLWSCKNDVTETSKHKKYVTVGFSISDENVPAGVKDNSFKTSVSRSIKPPVAKENHSPYEDRCFNIKIWDSEAGQNEYICNDTFDYSEFSTLGVEVETGKNCEYEVSIYEDDTYETLIDTVRGEFSSETSVLLPITFTKGLLDISFLCTYYIEQILISGNETKYVEVESIEDYEDDDGNFKYAYKGVLDVESPVHIYCEVDEDLIDIEQASIYGGLVSQKHDILVNPFTKLVTISFDLGEFSEENPSFTKTLKVEPNTAYNEEIDGTNKTLLETINEKVPTSETAVFVGWYKDKACTIKFEPNESVCVSSDFTLYARYITPKFLEKGDKKIPVDDTSGKFEVDGSLVKLRALDQQVRYSRRYIFAGWYSDPDFENELQRNSIGNGENILHHYWIVDIETLENPIYARYVQVNTYNYNSEYGFFTEDNNTYEGWEWDIDFYENRLRIIEDPYKNNEYLKIYGLYEDSGFTKNFEYKTQYYNYNYYNYWCSSLITDYDEVYSIYPLRLPAPLYVEYHFDEQDTTPEDASFLEKFTTDYLLNKSDYETNSLLYIPQVPVEYRSDDLKDKIFMGWSVTRNANDLLENIEHDGDYVSLFDNRNISFEAAKNIAFNDTLDLYAIYISPIQILMHESSELNSSFVLNGLVSEYDYSGYNSYFIDSTNVPELEKGKMILGWYYLDAQGSKRYLDYWEDENKYHLDVLKSMYSDSIVHLYPDISDIVTINYPAELLANNPSLPTQYITPNFALEIPTPKKDGYVFAGWYEDEECTTVADVLFYEGKNYIYLQDNHYELREYDGRSYNLYPKWIQNDTNLVLYTDYSIVTSYYDFDEYQTKTKTVSKRAYKYTNLHDDAELEIFDDSENGLTSDEGIIGFVTYETETYYLKVQNVDSVKKYIVTTDFNYIYSEDDTPENTESLFHIIDNSNTSDTFYTDIYSTKDYIYLAINHSDYNSINNFDVIKIEKSTKNVIEQGIAAISDYYTITNFRFFANNDVIGLSYESNKTNQYAIFDNILVVDTSVAGGYKYQLNDDYTTEINDYLHDVFDAMYVYSAFYDRGGYEITDVLIDKDNKVYSLISSKYGCENLVGSLFVYDLNTKSYNEYLHINSGIIIGESEIITLDTVYTDFLFGPRKFLVESEEPKKLVIADDGIFVYVNPQSYTQSYTNVNRVVFVDIEDDISIEAIALVEEEFGKNTNDNFAVNSCVSLGPLYLNILGD